MPTVVLEAMSYGKPVIVTDVGATRELVDSSNGYVIPKNNVEELVKAIVSFHELSDDERRALGETSRRKVEERFVWEAVAEEYLKLFKSVEESRMEKVND
jgi:glycosyltransferase involved in cell wall biosynthesis